MRTYPELDTLETGVSIDRHILQDMVLSLSSQPAVAMSPTLMKGFQMIDCQQLSNSDLHQPGMELYAMVTEV